GKLLERMLPTLRIPSELVVVLDQGSTDSTEAVCHQAGVHLKQLGRPHTYTEACNIGADLAKERGCEFVFVANNDITFTTDVMRELLAELVSDPDLGIVAPAQMLIDEAAGVRKLAYRVFWDLEELTFMHDFEAPSGTPHRLESDFCELTFAGVRMSTIDKIGFLDNDYGFYHEDADFGFRLRDAGFTCAYLPNSQIEHWTSSTVAAKPSQFKLNYLTKNKRLFSQKFLGHYVAHQSHRSNETNSWNIVNKNLHPYLRKYGLVHPNAPELIFTHPGVEPFDFLYTVWETSKPPASWLAYADRYKMILTTSRWGVDVLKDAGFQRVHYAPLGVESDIFQPWGPSERIAEGKTFLWFSRNQHRKGLDVMLKAWRAFHRVQPTARLILMGIGIEQALPAPDTSRVWKHSRISEHHAEGISVYENFAAADEEMLAAVYRSVDFTVCSSRSEGFGFSVAESMACGTPAIFGNFSSTSDFSIPGSLLLGGTPTKADYSDKGFGDVGDWWEPSAEQLTALLFEANDMDAQRYRHLSEAGVRDIRTKFSWRESSLAIRRALIAENAGKISTSSRSIRKAQFSAKPTTTIAGPLPLRQKVSRAIRRVGLLLAFFADRADSQGYKSAISESSKKLISPRLKARLKSLKPGQPASHGRASATDALRHGTLFIGYAEGALGLGQAFRANLTAAESAGLKFSIYPFQVGIETRLIEPFMPHRYDTSNPYEVNVIEVAADQLPVVFQNLEPRLLKDSYNILCTYWELSKAPEAWRSHLENIHEIWAPNKFIADAFAHIFDGPIIVMPPAMEKIDGTYPPRSHFGMDEGRFYFMFSFDYYSSPFRKNPLGVLQAFQFAFPRGDENVGLVIKSTGAADHHADIKAVIEAAAAKDSRILILDRNMPRDEILGLIRASDVYVSLHRAEGFGLGMAEAMTFERIVIGTDYSGCTEFLTDKTGYPVPYDLRPLGSHEYPWSHGQTWAEPDQAAAIEIMRRVAANPSQGKARGKVAREHVLRLYNPSAVGEAIRGRLEALAVERKLAGAPAQ
ncbi:MAG: glycosyltransferase, partial [Steroidobacteraceae bacterium]